MRHADACKIVGTGLLSLSLAVAAVPAQSLAQGAAEPGMGVEQEQDDGMDWGWLGLLGLAGLLGLKGRDRDDRRPPPRV